MNIPRAILSDADGTLVDTVHLIRHGQYETAKTYLTQHGVPAADIPEYEAYEAHLNEVVGGSARDTLERTVRLLYQNQPTHLKGMDFDALHDMLNPVQDSIAPEFVKAYDGLPKLLSYLGTTGIKLAIFTSGTPHHIVRNFGVSLPELQLTELYKDKSISDSEKLRIFEKSFAEHFGLPGFTVVTCEDTVTHKPDPEGINLAMKRLNVMPADAIVLGDHKVDIESGINAGVQVLVGIAHGFSDETALNIAGATKVVRSLNELIKELS